MFAFFPSNLWQPCWIFKMAAVFIWNTAISQLLSIKDTCFLCLNIYFWDINPGIISCHLSWAWDWAQKSKMPTSFDLIWAISGPESPPVTTLTILESLEWVETRFWAHLEVPRPQNCHQGREIYLPPPPPLPFRWRPPGTQKHFKHWGPAELVPCGHQGV